MLRKYIVKKSYEKYNCNFVTKKGVLAARLKSYSEMSKEREALLPQISCCGECLNGRIINPDHDVAVSNEKGRMQK